MSKIRFDIFLDVFENSGLTKADLGRMLDLKSNALQGWFDRESVPAKYLYPVADILHVNPRFLLGETEDDSRFQIIPVIGESNAVAPSMSRVEPMERFKTVERHYFGEGAYGIIASDDSMAGKIDSGALCICNPSSQVREGDVVHYSWAGESGIRRYSLSVDKMTVVLKPDNTNYSPIFIPYDSDQELVMVRVDKVEQDL